MNLTLNLVALLILIICSGFFSGSETGMMSLNRYRLRHLVRKGNKKAKRVSDLLARTDRLLGVILIGNTFANILASALATIIAVHFFGDIGVLVSTVVLTLIILIFAETTPKTLAALHPMRFAFVVSLPLKILLKLFYPLVLFVNGIANATLRVLRVPFRSRNVEPLSAEELRTVVNEATGKISVNYQQMLLRILDLEQVTVADIMVPRSEIHGIDLQDEWDTIEQQLAEADHAYLPIYRENIDRVQGVLNLRKVLAERRHGELSKTKLTKLADEVYFVPEGAQLNRQLLNFQEHKRYFGLVVDEYGDIQGLITLQDVLEEIVGEFAKGVDESSEMIKEQRDGSYLIDGRINLRDLEKLVHWGLNLRGPKTLGGLIIEYLEMIPTPGIGVRIEGIPMEVIEVKGNTVRLVQVWPTLKCKPTVLTDEISSPESH